ncbi:MAG: zinc-binding alcohol dehydrogenase family protein [Flavobacteriales bacterium]
MKAYFLTKKGSAEDSIELRDVDKPAVKEGEVLVKTSHFGLNFADVIMRQGLYREAPDFPFIPGYDACGIVEEIGEGVSEDYLGKRVVLMCKFGGYAEYISTNLLGVALLPEEVGSAEATAFGTQYLTAWYMSVHMQNLLPGDKVLIHAAAGGVGTALVQLCKWKGAEIYATAGSNDKIAALEKAGVKKAINYKMEDYAQVLQRELKGERLTAAFNAIAGSTFKKDLRLLGSGGVFHMFGAAERSGQKGGMWSTLGLLRKMGLLLPIMLMGKSRGIIGTNMLKVASHKPEVIQRGLEHLLKLHQEGHIKPLVGEVFKHTEINKAHILLENRGSKGKLVIEW